MTRDKKKLCENPDRRTDADFAETISGLVKNLYYISETDSAIFPFTGAAADAVTGEEILRQTEKDSNTPIEERNFAEFFGRLTAEQDWFGRDEKRRAKKFEKLKNFLEENLRDLKVFKIGSIEIDIYAVGLNSDGKLAGIRMKAVET